MKLKDDDFRDDDALLDAAIREYNLECDDALIRDPDLPDHHPLYWGLYCADPQPDPLPPHVRHPPIRWWQQCGVWGGFVLYLILGFSMLE